MHVALILLPSVVLTVITLIPVVTPKISHEFSFGVIVTFELSQLHVNTLFSESAGSIETEIVFVSPGFNETEVSLKVNEEINVTDSVISNAHSA